MVVPKQTTFGIAQSDYGKRMVFILKTEDPDRMQIMYINPAPNSGDPFGYKVPLDCDEWCMKHGYESVVIPYEKYMDVPTAVARAIWRWLQGEGWKRYPATV